MKTSFPRSIAMLVVIILTAAAVLAIVSSLSAQPPALQPAAQAIKAQQQIPTPIATHQRLPNPVSTYSPGAATPSVMVTSSPPTPRATTVSRGTPEPTPELIGKADFGSWNYVAYKDDLGHSFATIRYDFQTIGGIQAYVDDNKKLASQLVSNKGQVEVYVTFRNYVSPEQFRAWVKSTGLANGPNTQVYGIVRMMQQDGTRITAYTGPDAQTDKVQARWADTGATVKGIYAAHGWVSTDNLAALQTDPMVFLVDVTPNVIRKDLATHGVADVMKVDVRMQTETPFWTMEDAGLDKFRQ